MDSDFQRIGPYLWVKQNNPYATNTGLLIKSGQACLIDPGISFDNLAEIKHFVAKSHAEVHMVILTHAHWDHLLGAAWFPNARVVAHQSYLNVIRDHGANLVQQVASWRASVGHAPVAWYPPVTTQLFIRELKLSFAGIVLHLIHTPGHTVDHTSVYILQGKILWAGDMLSDLELPLVEDIRAYTQALESLATLDTGILIPGHGTPALVSPEISARFAQDRCYLQTLYRCVQSSVLQGFDCLQTVHACAQVPFAQPDDYPEAQTWNIESAYRTLGGRVDSPSGWEKEWELSD